MPQTVQIQADWAQTDSTQIDFIKNKPNLYEEWWGTQAEYDAILVKDPDKIYNIIYEEPQINYFYVEDISGLDNTLSIVGNTANVPATEIFKSTDGENWTSMGTTSDTAITATIPANKKLYLKATTNALSTNWNNYVHTSTTGNYNIGGCIASLIFGDNFESGTITDGTNDFAFGFLFYNDIHLIDASNLTLPNSTATRCYQSMFSGCTNLVTPPSVMYGERAYINQCENMFANCTSMTTTPQLQATTLGNSCYRGMFNGCTGLTTAPALPVTTLTDSCYREMFRGCTSLTTAPELPATTLADYCYQYMFQGCTGLTTAPVLPATTLADYCYNGMFQGCTSLTTAPVLNATTLARSCYYRMFLNCTSLTTAPALPATTLVGSCYREMFNGCTSLTTAPSMSTTTTGDTSCFGMFKNCTSLTASPTLLTATLTNNCYYEMFAGCKNIHTVTTYASDISANGCLYHWLSSVAATGDFYNLGGATYTSGDSGIPSGWTEHNSL